MDKSCTVEEKQAAFKSLKQSVKAYLVVLAILALIGSSPFWLGPILNVLKDPVFAAMAALSAGVSAVLATMSALSSLAALIILGVMVLGLCFAFCVFFVLMETKEVAIGTRQIAGGVLCVALAIYLAVWAMLPEIEYMALASDLASFSGAPQTLASIVLGAAAIMINIPFVACVLAILLLMMAALDTTT